MGVLSVSRRVMESMIDKSYRAGQLHGEKKKIRDTRRKEIYSLVELTDEQKRKIDRFYSHYFGKKVSYKWHRLYQAFTGTFNEKYLPEYIFSSIIEPMWNPKEYRDALSDKNLLDIFTQVGGYVTQKYIYLQSMGVLTVVYV